MNLLVELGQIVLALIVSGAVAYLVGPVYIAVSALVLATCVVLLFDAEKHRSIALEIPIGLSQLLSITGTSIAFGLVWPAIPMILTWKRISVTGERDDGDEA